MFIHTLPGQQFYNATEEAGLVWPSDGSLWRWEVMHTAMIDYDGDGDLDLWTAPHRWGKTSEDPVQRPVIWRHREDGTFSPLRLDDIYVNNGDKHETIWFDYDNDGDLDVYVNTGGRAGQLPPPALHRGLYRNDGDDIFIDIGSEVGLSPSVGSGRGNAVLDWNSDGLLDFVQFSADVSGEGPYARLYLRLSDGSFELQDTSSGFDIPGDTFFGLVVDLFGDGQRDLLCFDGEVNSLGFLARAYELSMPMIDRRDELPFEIQTTGQELRDATVGDFNGDLIADIIAVQTPNRYGPAASEEDLPNHIQERKSPPVFIRSSSDGSYTAAEGVGLEPYYGMSVGSGDFDNDMDLDLYMTGQVGQLGILPKYYSNNGDGTFTAIPEANGATRPYLDIPHVYDQAAGMGFVIGDINGDGFLDIYVSPQPSPVEQGPLALQSALFLNRGNDNHWLQLELEGVESNREGIGAKILASAGGVTQLREITNGQRRVSQDPNRVHFGLAQISVVDQLQVIWPSGVVAYYTHLNADQRYTLSEDDPACDYRLWADTFTWSQPNIDGAPLSDPNDDGVANLMAYAADLSPFEETTVDSFASIRWDSGVKAFIVTYRRAAGGSPGVHYEILEATNLGANASWTPVDFDTSENSLEVLPEDPDGDGSAERVRAVVPLGNRDRLFLRYRVRLGSAVAVF